MADVVADAELAEPRVLLVELQRAVVEVEALEREDPEADLDERDERRERARPSAASSGSEPDDERAGHRQEDQDRRQPARHRVARKTTARTASPLASASA